jgi:hypothetical protein
LIDAAEAICGHPLPQRKAGPPYEVLGVDGKALARFRSLARAEAFAATEANKVGAEVIRSPHAQGHM